MTEVVMTTGAISHAKLQINHHQQTNTQLFMGRVPFLSPKQQCQSTEEKKYHIPWTVLAHLMLAWGLPALTTTSSWLPGVGKYFLVSFAAHG